MLNTFHFYLSIGSLKSQNCVFQRWEILTSHSIYICPLGVLKVKILCFSEMGNINESSDVETGFEELLAI